MNDYETLVVGLSTNDKDYIKSSFQIIFEDLHQKGYFPSCDYNLVDFDGNKISEGKTPKTRAHDTFIKNRFTCSPLDKEKYSTITIEDTFRMIEFCFHEVSSPDSRFIFIVDKSEANKEGQTQYIEQIKPVLDSCNIQLNSKGHLEKISLHSQMQDIEAPIQGMKQEQINQVRLAQKKFSQGDKRGAIEELSLMSELFKNEKDNDGLSVDQKALSYLVNEFGIRHKNRFNTATKITDNEILTDWLFYAMLNHVITRIRLDK